MKYGNSEQTLSLIKNVLCNKCFSENNEILVQTSLLNCDKNSGFDSKGSARIEVLCSSEDRKDDGKKITLHGLAENIDEQRMSMTLFCETRWLDNDFVREKSNDIVLADMASVVMDFAKEQEYLPSAVFVLSVKSKKNGQDVGHGSGYLLFENEAELLT